MWILPGRERVEVVVEGLNQSRGKSDDIDVGRSEILDAGILQRDRLAAPEREDHVGAHLAHRGGDVGERFEAGAVKLQDVPADAGLEVGDDIVAVAHGHDKGVASSSASEHVIAPAAIDHVVAGIADDNVVEIVTGGRGAIAVAQRQIFDIGRINEAVAVNHAVVDRVNTLAGEFDHLRAVIIHKVRIVACTADQA